KLSALLSVLPAPANDHPSITDRSPYERFAIPYSFKPRMSFAQALGATLVAFFRIFLGSLLFAAWGTSVLVAWSTIRGVFWRVSAVFGLLLLFPVLFPLLMLAIAAAARFLSRRPARA